MPDEKQLFISVVIANRNHARLLELCLKSIFQSKYKDFEVIVVDDDSTDESVEIAKRFPCKVIELDQNVGQGFARNIGVDKSKGEIVFFIDSDTVIVPDALKIINENLSGPDVDAVIGIVDKTPLSGGITARYMCLDWYHHATRQEERYSDYFFALVGAIRKGLFNDVGQFKHPWMDDFEFNNRLPPNTRIVMDRRLVIKHTYGSFSKVFSNFFIRASVWINLKRVKRVDKTFYPLRRVLGVGFSLLTLGAFLVSLPLFVISRQDLIFLIPASFLLLFTAMNVDLFAFIFREGGVLLGLYSFVCRFSFSLAIALGSIFGKMKWWLR